MQNKISVEYNYSDEDLKDILSLGLEGGIGYWAVLCNNTEDWVKARQTLKEKTNDLPTYEDVIIELFDNGKSVKFCDAENTDEEWELTKDKFLHGIALNIQNRKIYDVEDMDSDDGDAIFQYALFNEIVYC